MKSLLSTLFSVGFLGVTGVLINANLPEEPEPAAKPTLKDQIAEIGYRAAVTRLSEYLPGAEFPNAWIGATDLGCGKWRVRGQVVVELNGTRSHLWCAIVTRQGDKWCVSGVSLVGEEMAEFVLYNNNRNNM